MPAQRQYRTRMKECKGYSPRDIWTKDGASGRQCLQNGSLKKKATIRVIGHRIETESSRFPRFTSVKVNHTKGHARVQKIYLITMMITLHPPIVR